MLRTARVADAKLIQALVRQRAEAGDMLHRPLNEIFEQLRDFVVFEQDGEVKGCAALHIVWEDLAEIRSLAVSPEHEGQGIGQQMVKHCINEAKNFGVAKIFALTYLPQFFQKFGFNEIDKQQLPHKIWGDCIKCHKFPDCDESAMMKEL